MAGSKLGTDGWLAVGRDGTKARGRTRRVRDLETTYVGFDCALYVWAQGHLLVDAAK